MSKYWVLAIFNYVIKYRKLVVVCSRASLSDNCRIFQFLFLTKLGVAWVVYTWEFIDRQTLKSLQIGIETDLDEFETITIVNWRIWSGLFPHSDGRPYENLTKIVLN